MNTKVAKFHLCVSIRGALKMSNRELQGFLAHEGRELSGPEAREFLMDELQKGRTVMPCCKQEECPEFDYMGGGCPGHPAASADTEVVEVSG